MKSAAARETLPEETITYTRKKKSGGRKPFADTIPREDVLIDIDEDEKQNACDHEMVRFGEEFSEQLDLIFVGERLWTTFFCSQRGKSGISFRNTSMTIIDTGHIRGLIESQPRKRPWKCE